MNEIEASNKKSEMDFDDKKNVTYVRLFFLDRANDTIIIAFETIISSRDIFYRYKIRIIFEPIFRNVQSFDNL